ncbi:hypothetical protein Dimus_005960 [Dionaea muscipula]
MRKLQAPNVIADPDHAATRTPADIPTAATSQAQQAQWLVVAAQGSSSLSEKLAAPPPRRRRPSLRRSSTPRLSPVFSAAPPIEEEGVVSLLHARESYRIIRFRFRF